MRPQAVVSSNRRNNSKHNELIGTRQTGEAGWASIRHQMLHFALNVFWLNVLHKLLGSGNDFS